MNATVIGISYDEPEQHAKFRLKFRLPFLLLSDKEKKVTRMYGADAVLSARWVTYVIDKEGNISAVYAEVDVLRHSAEILDFLSRVK